MENASKALIIAGAMLLIILVLSLAIFLFTQMAGESSNIYGKMDESQIAEFNRKYLQFNGRGTTVDDTGNPINPLKIQDVITIINLAKDDNTTKKFPVEIKVILGTQEVQETNSSDLVKMLNNNIEKTYSCQVDYATNSEIVGSVTIQEITT